MTPIQWAAGHLARWRVVTAQTEFVVRRHIEEVWELISDTNRLNLLAGLPPIRVRKMADKTSARFKVETRLSGFGMVYDEEPYEWQRPEFFRVTRKVRKGGPTHVIQMSFYLGPGANPRETRILLRAMVLPDWWIMGPLLRPLVWLNLYKLRLAIVRVSREMRIEAAVARKQLSRKVVLPDALLRHATEAQKALAFELTHADDQAVASIRPREFACRHEIETLSALAALMRATKNGYLVMRLELSCPSCLTHVGPFELMWSEQRCHMCELKLDGNPDNLELLFAPSPSIRRAEATLFCPGGPANLPHVYVQTIVVAGGVGRIKLPKIESKTFRLFARGGDSLIIVTKSKHSAANIIGLSVGQFGQYPHPIHVGLGTVITLVNPTDCEVHIKLEDANAPQMSATAHDVLKMQESDPEMFSGSESVFDEIRALLESYRKIMLSNGGVVDKVDD